MEVEVALHALVQPRAVAQWCVVLQSACEFCKLPKVLDVQLETVGMSCKEAEVGDVLFRHLAMVCLLPLFFDMIVGLVGFLGL